MGKVKDLTGHKYGKLTVIAPNKPENGYMTWKCKCDCGGEIIASSNRLKTGGVKSCGCMRTKSAQSAGKSRFIDLTGQQFQFPHRPQRQWQEGQATRPFYGNAGVIAGTSPWCGAKT
jgi:hypothetical protein